MFGVERANTTPMTVPSAIAGVARRHQGTARVARLDHGVELVDLTGRLRAPVDVEPGGLEGGGHAGLAGSERAPLGVPEDHTGRAPGHHGGSTGRAGSASPGTRSTAMSSLGSNSAAVVAWRPVESMTSGDAIPATTCALVTTSPGATTNPEPSWMTPHPAPAIWTVDPSARSTAARAEASVGRVTGRRRLGREPGEDDGEAVLGEEPLHAGEDRRDGGEHGVEGAHDARLLQRPGRAPEYWLLLQQDGHQPGDDERHGHRHGHTEDGVHGPETQPLQDPARARPEQPAHTTHDDGHPDSTTTATTALAVPPWTSPATDGATQRAEERAEQEPAEGQHLHGGAEPQPVDARQRHDDEQHVVDPVHRRRSFPTCASVHGHSPTDVARTSRVPWPEGAPREGTTIRVTTRTEQEAVVAEIVELLADVVGAGQRPRRGRHLSRLRP